MQKRIRIASDPAFGEALLREGIDTMLAGDINTGKAVLRDYNHARKRRCALGDRAERFCRDR
jgi:hypothetical protein